MTDLGKFLITAGLVLILAGAVVWALGRFGFRGLRGDIRYEGENVRFYFPIVTCLALSAVASLLVWAWRWLGKK